MSTNGFGEIKMDLWLGQVVVLRLGQSVVLWLGKAMIFFAMLCDA